MIVIVKDILDHCISHCIDYLHGGVGDLYI